MNDHFSQFKAQVKEVEERLARELSSIRTGRATLALLDNVKVEAYGSRLPLAQVGTVGVEDPRTLKITLWDKSQVKAVDTALQAANLGVSVLAAADAIRIIFPELTADKRQLLLKLAEEKVEQGRIALRQAREEVWNDLQAKNRAGDLSDDDKFRLKDELQKLVDEAKGRLEAAGERKVAEIKN